MDVNGALLVLATTPESTLSAINRCFAKTGNSITLADARMLEQQRAECLVAVERVEFGTPAVVVIAEAIGGSPHLTQTNTAATLARLQSTFYDLRDELPIEVPDEEIVDAICSCFDEQGDVAEVAAMPADELMTYSEAYVHAQNEERLAEYRIVDDEGRAYSFKQAGWGGEGWDNGWDVCNGWDVWHSPSPARWDAHPDNGATFDISTPHLASWNACEASEVCSDENMARGRSGAHSPDPIWRDAYETTPGWDGEGWSDDWDD